MPMVMSACKKRLAVLWAVAFAALFIVMILQSLFGHYGDKVSDAWGWFLPTILPTLSLIVGVFVADHLNKAAQAEQIDGFLFWLTFWLSALYILTVALPILAQPFVDKPPIDLMHLTNFWMGPFQAIVTTMLGVFFIKRKSR